jgi:multiple sugar transport system permease protein
LQCPVDFFAIFVGHPNEAPENLMRASVSSQLSRQLISVRLCRIDTRMLALIAPAALTMLPFQVVPIVIGANASFRDWSLYDPKKTWVGLKHYIAVINDPVFVGTVLPNTLLFLALSVSFSLLFGLALAILLNRNFRGQHVVRTILLVPLMVAPVVASIMVRWMFNDQFGIVNVVLEVLGFEPIAWLAYRRSRSPSSC